VIKLRNILIESVSDTPVSKHRVEIVERKGVGHPDYICDAIMEEISRNLSKEYLKKAGRILHHNIDKGLLIAGQVERRLGGGKVLEPIRLVIGDRATVSLGGEKFQVEEIAEKTAKSWIEKNLRFLNAELDVQYEVALKPGSQELAGIFSKKDEILPANDTSAAVGYAPLTITEKLVLFTERFLNSSEFKERHPETGEDIKVMAFREGEILHLTIALAFLDRYIFSEEDYFAKKKEIYEELRDLLNQKKEDLKEVKIYINTLDKEGKGLEGMYLTVTGTSAEDADSGEVGRGNRVNGVIALNRPMGTEAAAGKNPVSHVGKIYNVLSHKIAEEVYQGVEGLEEVYIWLCSQIGYPIDKPLIASAQLILKPKVLLGSVRSKVRDIIDAELENIKDFCYELIEGKYAVC
jgi:S-adenosylmethionine synthetase